MPSYEYRCADCGRTQVQFRPSELRHNPAICECGCYADKIISRANITMNDWAYRDNPIGTSKLDELATYREETKQYENQNGQKTEFAETSSTMQETIAGRVG